MVVHAAYVLNVATPDETKWGRAAAGLAKELERAAALGAGAVCFHPGAATDGEVSVSIDRGVLLVCRPGLVAATVEPRSTPYDPSPGTPTEGAIHDR